MSSNASAFIGDDLIIEGDLRSKGAIEVGGIVTGSVSASSLTVSQGGRVFGVVRTDTAEVNGTLQGTVLVRNLIRIGSTGSVSGDVRYGQLALELGGELSAEVTNVPPALVGDMQIVVRRGHSVRVTTEDINAIDPDDEASALTFTVTCPAGGHMARVEAPDVPVDRFSKSDVLGGAIVYVHDGRPGRSTSVAITVSDSSGATSGPPQQLHVAVTDA